MADPMMSATAALSPVTMTIRREADPPERPDRPWRLGPERIVEDQGAADRIVDPDEGARRTLDRGTAPDVARPARQSAIAGAVLRRPDRDPPAVDEPDTPAPGVSTTRSGIDSSSPRSRAPCTIEPARTCGDNCSTEAASRRTAP